MTDQKPPGTAPTVPQRLHPRDDANDGSRDVTAQQRRPDQRTSADTQPLPRVQEAPQEAGGSAPGGAAPGGSAPGGSAPRGSAQGGAAAQRPAADRTAGSQPASGANAATAAAPSRGESAPAQSAAKPRSKADTRKARLRLVRLDPWSVMKTAFALSIALAIVIVVAVTIVWAVLGAAGVWDAINSSVATVLSGNAGGFDITDYVGFGRIIGLTVVISAVDVILITAIATVGAFLYNLAAGLLGGLEVTLAEER